MSMVPFGLRQEMTDAEVGLWVRLRGEQIDGHRFRRQVPVGPYVADFACLKARIVVEVDGGQHADEVERDQQRTDWLASRGFKVLRFWNTEVLQQTNEMVESIREALIETPSLPSPQGGGTGLG
ncbi:MAG: endonuclease domain-containing protein [Candidatus Dormibacteraeota bacterium]|nr:endonuclease domain-containing protein [Candidatus Dormibacteraeota bacterium]